MTIEQLEQALHDARIENSGQAAYIETLSAEVDSTWIMVEAQTNMVNFLKGELDDANKKIADLEAALSWIPVEKRLPQRDCEVVVRFKSSPIPAIAWIGVDGDWCSCDRSGLVTHWMPLPELPKEEGK